MIDLLTEHARELVDMPAEWDSYEWEALGIESMGETQTYLIRGAVAPVKKRGPEKGHKNWQKMDIDTKRDVYITPSNHDSWLLQWEQRTGKCSKCVGRGIIAVGWSKETGTRTTQCKKCSGSGSANH